MELKLQISCHQNWPFLILSQKLSLYQASAHSILFLKKGVVWLSYHYQLIWYTTSWVLWVWTSYITFFFPHSDYNKAWNKEVLSLAFGVCTNTNILFPTFLLSFKNRNIYKLSLYIPLNPSNQPLKYSNDISKLNSKWGSLRISIVSQVLSKWSPNFTWGDKILNWLNCVFLILSFPLLSFQLCPC